MFPNNAPCMVLFHWVSWEATTSSKTKGKVAISKWNWKWKHVQLPEAWKNANDTVAFGFSPAFHWVTGRRQFSRQSQSEIMQNQSNLRLFWMLGYKFSWYFPVIQIVFHSAFVTKPCSTFPKPLFQNEGKSWKLFQPQRCQFFFTRKEKCLVVLCAPSP